MLKIGENPMGTIANFTKQTATPVTISNTIETSRTELMRTDRLLIVRLTLPVGATLTPECHLHTRKKIVVLEGAALLNLPSCAQRLLEDEHATVPAGTFHRLENHGKIPLVALEIRTGITDIDDRIAQM
jgi:mannose-6-phosphate isomerase-like protein (cupin superfamily)